MDPSLDDLLKKIDELGERLTDLEHLVGQQIQRSEKPVKDTPLEGTTGGD